VTDLIDRRGFSSLTQATGQLPARRSSFRLPHDIAFSSCLGRTSRQPRAFGHRRAAFRRQRGRRRAYTAIASRIKRYTANTITTAIARMPYRWHPGGAEHYHTLRMLSRTPSTTTMPKSKKAVMYYIPTFPDYIIFAAGPITSARIHFST
jgi:hypothetical protein